MAEGVKRLHLVSLGCAKNRVDSEEMVALLGPGEWELVADPAQADAILVNTCAFIRPATQESIDTILELSRYKNPDQGACRRLVVAGCLPQRYGQELTTELPEVDLFLGVADRKQVKEALEGESTSRAWISPTPRHSHEADAPADPDRLPVLRQSSLSAHSAWLKISDGCDHACSFCVIPSIRGRLRSRPVEALVAEALHLARQGVVELNLVAQDSMAYGRDLSDGSTLTTLLRGLATVDGLRWIRVLYAYPSEPPPDLLQVMAGEEKVCRYLDMPLQHASDRVLKAMRRGVNRAAQDRLLERLRAEVPGITLRTTFIVGFPGETDPEFDELLAYLDTWRFEHVGAFRYYDEEGSHAATLPEAVPPRVRLRRLNRLLSAQARVSRQILRGLKGQVHEVLVDQPSEDAPGLFEGRLQNQAPEVDGKVYLTSPEVRIQPGQILPVRISKTTEVDLYGEVEGE